MGGLPGESALFTNAHRIATQQAAVSCSDGSLCNLRKASRGLVPKEGSLT